MLFARKNHLLNVYGRNHNVTSLLKDQPASFEQYGSWTSAKNQGHRLVPVVVQSKENNNCTGVNRSTKVLFCVSGPSGNMLDCKPVALIRSSISR